MDKFELLCLLEAISNYAYDIHYTAKGRYFFSDHLFSERLSDVDVKDDFIETFYLGKSEEAPSSADIARKVATLTPQITDNTQDNFKRLRDLIIRALMTIQKYDGTKGEEDILGAIAHILQRHNGLLYRQLTYTPEEIRNDDDDWRDIVSEEDTTQTLENEKWITVHPNKENPGDVDGFNPLTVSAVTAAIDESIVAGNIKSGVTILGVEGSVVELAGELAEVTPTTSSQTIEPTEGKNGFTSISVAAVTSAIDANILPENIKSGVTILGVEGTYTGE